MKYWQFVYIFVSSTFGVPTKAMKASNLYKKCNSSVKVDKCIDQTFRNVEESYIKNVVMQAKMSIKGIMAFS